VAVEKQSPGQHLVAEILAEMEAAGVVPAAKEEALLATACQIVDRLDALEKIIARDGEMLTSKTGVIRVHPAIPEHRQLAVSLPKVLAGIVVGDSTSGAAKNPDKVHAARVRWDRRDSLREAQAARAGL
jgi:Phage terminase, small subunit